MKKAFKYVAYAMMVLAPSMGFIACSSDDDSEGGNNNKKEKIAEDPLSPEDQKERLEQAALDLAAELPASDFEEVAALGAYTVRTYGPRYDWDNVGDWVEDSFYDLVAAVTPKVKTESDTYEGDGYTDISNDIYKNYKLVIAASNFTGEFTAEEGEWVQTNEEDVDYLCFYFKDQNGEDCSLKLETSKKTTSLFIGEFEKYDGREEENDYENNIYTYNYYYNQYNITAKVPEHAVLTLTQGGVVVAQLNLDVNLSGLSNNAFNLASSNVTVACTLAFPTSGPGYTIGFSKIAYSGNKKASVVFSLTKEEATLLSLAVAGDVSGLPSYKLGVSEGKPDVSEVNGKNVVVEIDVMGEVQLYGSLSNVMGFVEAIGNAKKNKADETNFKKYMEQANKMMSVGLYYDGEEGKQADFQLAAFGKSSKWEMVPTIYFYYDESSYAITDYFSAENFETVITTYKEMAQEYMGLIQETK